MAERPATTDLARRIEIYLGEFRIIIPGLAALLGFQLSTSFQSGFEAAPRLEQSVHLASILSTVLALVFLLLPTSYHRFVSRVEETEDFLLFAKANVRAAFVFVALTLVLSLYLQAWRILDSRPVGLGAALAVAATTLAAWWIVPLRRARRHADAAGAPHR